MLDVSKYSYASQQSSIKSKINLFSPSLKYSVISSFQGFESEKEKKQFSEIFWNIQNNFFLLTPLALK